MNKGRLGTFRWSIPLIVFWVALNLTLVPYSYCHAEKASTGDVDGDGQVTLQDMDKLLDIINSQGYQPTADLNGDGKVDITDLDMVEEIYRKSPAVRGSEQ
jgi:hypothetical protein